MPNSGDDHSLEPYSSVDAIYFTNNSSLPSSTTTVIMTYTSSISTYSSSSPVVTVTNTIQTMIPHILIIVIAAAVTGVLFLFCCVFCICYFLCRRRKRYRMYNVNGKMLDYQFNDVVIIGQLLQYLVMSKHQCKYIMCTADFVCFRSFSKRLSINLDDFQWGKHDGNLSTFGMN